MKTTISTIILIIIALLFNSCISTSKTDLITRAEIMQVVKKNKKPFSKVLVQWKNYPYSDYHKINNLEKEPSELKASEIDNKLYYKFKHKIIEELKQNSLYDEINGNGTLKVLLLTYGRWTYKELIPTYLTDTGYIFILPSSLLVTYRLIAIMEQGNITKRIENEGYVKTTFFLPLFPLYPLMTFNGAEKTTITNLINKMITDIVTSQNEN